LILGSLGLIQEAQAATVFFTSDTTITTSMTIASGVVWQVNNGVTLTINSGVTINIVGSLTNLGTINNDGTIINNGTIDNLGTINNSGTINNLKPFLNNGIISLTGNGLIKGEKGISNVLFGTIISGPTLTCGAGTTLVGDECEADVTQAQLDAAEAERDAALDDLNNLFTNNSCFPQAVTIQEVLDCIDALIADLATALDDLDAANTRIAELEAQLEEVGLPGPPVSNQGQGKGVPAQGKNKP